MLGIAILLSVILFYVLGRVLPQKEDIQEAFYPYNKVERTKNILVNHSFERELNASNWTITDKVANSLLAFDKFIKKDGFISLLIESGTEGDVSIWQVISRIEYQRKYVLFGSVRSEGIDSMRVSIEVYSSTDSLLFKGISETLKKDNDWIVLSTWVRTQEEFIGYLKVVASVWGNGGTWLDNFKLYALPINYPFNQINFNQ